MSLTIKLVRHGQSRANVGDVEARDVGDHTIELTEQGHRQARAVGATLGADYLRDALVYCSPYARTRQTLTGILEGAGLSREVVRSYEDPRLREVDPGYEEYEAQHALRRTHGWFYYRFKGGESPADCFDRTSSFLESLMRQVERKAADHVLIVTHGLTIRCFAMRFLHLSVEQFDELANPGNCDLITIGDKHEVKDAGWTTGRWALSGLKRRAPEEG
jgi:broad specificity phosphatase PhoE